MPFQKQKRYQVDDKKQNKLIKKRLLEISICVDNYIYNNKDITVAEAENYAREILIYKLQCNGDISMLQVIEKLTRFMKSIIEETTKKICVNQNSIASVIEKSGTFSSTSSVDKEDSSCMSEVDKSLEILAFKNTVCDNIEEKPTNHTEQEPEKSVFANEKQYFKIDNTTLTVPANIRSTGEVKTANTFASKDISTQNFNIDQHKHDNDNVNSGFVNENTSKIISNAERLITHSKPKTYIKDTLHKFRPPMRSYQTNLEAKNCKDTGSLLHQNRTGDENDTIKKKISKPTDLKTTGKKRKRAPKKSDKDMKNNIKSHTGTPRRRATNKKPKTTQSNNLKGNNTSPKLLPNNKSTCVNDEMPLPKSWDESNGVKDISKHMQSLEINKRFVENDLSWVDRIRNVREIGSTEFDVKSNYLHEAFWDDYTLPNGWDDSEFLY